MYKLCSPKRIISFVVFVGILMLFLVKQHSEMHITSESLPRVETQTLTAQSSYHESPATTTTAATTTPPDDGAWLQLQEQRRNTVREVCQSDKSLNGKFRKVSPSRAVNAQMKVDDKHKVIYCFVPKAACTSWKSLFISLSGADDIDPDHPQSIGRHRVHDLQFLATHGLKSLGSYPEKGIKERLATYTKFLVVRHPFLRLHSAFRDKFGTYREGGSEFQWGWGKEIIRMYRDNASEASLRTGQNVTLDEFLRYLGNPAIADGRKFEPHWTPYHSLCRPCAINYDYIATTETLERDSANILQRAFNTSGQLWKLHEAKPNNVTGFEDIPKEIIDKLFVHFGPDFKLFGYKWPLHL